MSPIKWFVDGLSAMPTTQRSLAIIGALVVGTASATLLVSDKVRLPMKNAEAIQSITDSVIPSMVHVMESHIQEPAHPNAVTHDVFEPYVDTVNSISRKVEEGQVLQCFTAIEQSPGLRSMVEDCLTESGRKRIREARLRLLR